MLDSSTTVSYDCEDPGAKIAASLGKIIQTLCFVLLYGRVEREDFVPFQGAHDRTLRAPWAQHPHTLDDKYLEILGGNPI